MKRIDPYLHDPIARAETYLGRVNHIEASARARANVALTSLELSDEKRDMLLRSLTDVGATKPIGYLPLYTIKEFLRSDPETIAADAVMRGLTTAQFAQNACCIKSGALYAYHRAALGDLLRENAAAVRVAGLPLDPDEFVAHVAANWYEMGHEAHPLIAAAFGEKFVENPAVLSRPEHYQ
ncbi:hypothetical protein K9B32_07500 [Rhizobium sp. 3T7]|uniref:hypothetical protein n=1 Tax=Rhizobium sp. 3T7 TaxID=2874922 RepID=UPI001CD0215A|nr:hypothetical protein [Rhizobium sp. 3T7]MBZ9789974.1 hypothetical protein [Rhizobium sp. 3T7]